MEFIRKNAVSFGIITLVLCLASFFLITADSVFTVHDDILTYMQVQRGNLWQTAVDDAKHGRVGHIPLTFLLYIPYFFKSPLTVRVFSAGAVLFDMAGLYYLVKNNITKRAGLLSCILFISFACISNQHNLFVSYIIGHQIPSGMVLFALGLFTKYYPERKDKKRLIAGAALLTAASLLYEACTAYILLFLLTAFLKNEGKFSGKVIKAIKDNLINFAFLAAYVILYYLWRRSYPSDYSGSVLAFDNIPQSFITMFRYSFGMVPGLPAAAMLIKGYVPVSEILSLVRPWIIIAPLAAAVSFGILFPETDIKQKKSTLIIYCIAGILIPNIIISFTPKYAEWTASGSYAYVTSFYSYFFLIPLFILVLKCIVKKNSRVTTVCLSTLVFAVSLISAVNNTAWNCYFKGEYAMYRAFSDAVTSDYFDTLEDGTTVFIPDYTGIHHDMSITESFVSIYTDADLTFTNDAESIDFSRPVIMMKYDPEKKIISCGKMDNDMNFNADFHT
ncbi:MAG: hypothetical protein ILP22_04915 [Oscillospiraceae bacterium]|nr:hypothetical protein [Oscillospiraceae bacterium]